MTLQTQITMMLGIFIILGLIIGGIIVYKNSQKGVQDDTDKL